MVPIRLTTRATARATIEDFIRVAMVVSCCGVTILVTARVTVKGYCSFCRWVHPPNNRGLRSGVRTLRTTVLTKAANTLIAVTLRVP